MYNEAQNGLNTVKSRAHQRIESHLLFLWQLLYYQFRHCHACSSIMTLSLMSFQLHCIQVVPQHTLHNYTRRGSQGVKKRKKSRRCPFSRAHSPERRQGRCTISIRKISHFGAEKQVPIKPRAPAVIDSFCFSTSACFHWTPPSCFPFLRRVVANSPPGITPTSTWINKGNAKDTRRLLRNEAGNPLAGTVSTNPWSTRSWKSDELQGQLGLS